VNICEILIDLESSNKIFFAVHLTFEHAKQLIMQKVSQKDVKAYFSRVFIPAWVKKTLDCTWVILKVKKELKNTPSNYYVQVGT